MSSMLKKGIRAGMAGLSKGLFRKYEHQLGEEEAEADLLRKQHLASYENSLLTGRAKALAEHKADLDYSMEKKKALEAGDIQDEITMKESGKLYDSLAEREGIEGLPSKEAFQKDMLFISRASKGATPLSNDQKIEIIKNANEAWDKMSTLGGDEFDQWTAKHGANARQKFIESQINSSVFGGSSSLDKASKIVSKSKEENIIKEIKEGDPEQMIKKIMKSQKVKRKEAEAIYAEITGAPVIGPDKSKKRPGFLQQSFPGMFNETKDEKDESMLFNY